MVESNADAVQTLLSVENELNQRWPETKIEPSLDRIQALVDFLGDPQRSYPIVQVAGTNGKTSTARMIDALFTRIGLRTGRYTSPHLQSVTERISVDGAPISAERYAEIYHDIKPYISIVDDQQSVALSKFEVLTGMAFAAFADAPVDVAVVEVGLGGSWDATNVGDAKVAVIAPIAIDHTDYLGADIVGIAQEKAGIIKSGSTVILAEQSAEVAAEVLRRCAEVDATIARQGSEFGVAQREIAVGGQLLAIQGLGGMYNDIFLPLHGEHQARNAALALAAVEAFFGAGQDRQLDVEAVRDAFASVTSPGRLERVRTAPTVLLDAAHNPHGAAALAQALDNEFGFRKIVGVLGVMTDKDTTGILTALEPVLHELVLTQNSSSRAMDVDELAALAIPIFGEDRVLVEPRLDNALEAAIQLVEETDTPGEPVSGGGVVVTGSVVTVGEARTLLGRESA